MSYLWTENPDDEFDDCGYEPTDPNTPTSTTWLDADRKRAKEEGPE